MAKELATGLKNVRDASLKQLRDSDSKICSMETRVMLALSEAKAEITSLKEPLDQKITELT